MATRLKQFPKRLKADLPMARFCDGKIWRLVHGRDFSCPLTSISSTLYRTARVKGLVARIKMDGTRAVIVQTRRRCEPQPIDW